ncbi:MAG TPA: DUF5808 domain-containing protein [Thermomicrobiaceae bacterium]|nr:DUF5808 domain-containing protein [Thermomicrobiaceae bacterium]
MKHLSKLVGMAAIGLVASAIGQQLQLPPNKRTWTGHILGIPYDFRPPSLARVKERWWNPKNPHLLGPRVFGVGWSINLYQVKQKLASLVA